MDDRPAWQQRLGELGTRLRKWLGARLSTPRRKGVADERPVWQQLQDEHGTRVIRPQMPGDGVVLAISCGDDHNLGMMGNCYITVGEAREQNFLLQLYTHDIRFGGAIDRFMPQNLWIARKTRDGFYTFESRHEAGLFIGVGASRTFGEPVILQPPEGFLTPDEICWRVDWQPYGTNRYTGVKLTNKASGGWIYSPYDPAIVRGYQMYEPAPLCHGEWNRYTQWFVFYLDT